MNRIIQKQPHKATFRGRHNGSKSKVLLVLYDIMYTLGVNTGVTARELHLLSGVPFNTVRSRLGLWWKWGYLGRRGKADGAGKLAYHYALAARGKHFVEDRIPPAKLKQYTEEIKTFRKEKGVVLNTTPSRKEEDKNGI